MVSIIKILVVQENMSYINLKKKREKQLKTIQQQLNVKLKDCYLANQDDNVEELTEEEVDGILVKLVVDMLNKVVKKLDKLLTVIFNNPA